MSCKNIIAGILAYDYHQQKWARDRIMQIIDNGEPALRSLLDGLKDTIPLGESIGKNADEISNAIDSKNIAFGDADEIMEVISDLRRIVSEQDIVIGNSQFIGGYAETYADALAATPDKSGYDATRDIIIIDPEGTIGETIEISGLRIALPAVPPKKQIPGYDKPKQQQHWQRQPPPRELSPKTARAFEEFICDEHTRRRRGSWFYNNGKPEYITGSHWLLLTHCPTEADGKYYFFSKAQQKLFWFFEACWCDPRSFGVIVEKIRRFGMTHCVLAFSINKAIAAKDKNCGMTSKTDTDARKNFRKQTKMFAGMPFYMKPVCTSENSKSCLEFATPTRRLTKSGKDKEITENVLNTSIDFMSTDISSYDGTALYVYIADEFSKWKKQNGNTLTHWDTVKKCLTKGSTITGKALVVSTIENVTGKDPDDDDAAAGDRYKYLYENSDPVHRDANGRTVTGLYKLFISCLEHYEGFIDKYGYCIAEDPVRPVESVSGQNITTGVRTFVNNELAAIAGNMRATFEYKRKTPITEQDGFIIGEGSCEFNQANIQAQITFNTTLHPSPVRTGNFRWKNNIPDCGEAQWHECPDGRFRITWMPDPALRNNVQKIDGLLRPMNQDIGAFGIDPYRVNKTADGKGSKGSMHGFARHNAKGAPNNAFFLEYIDRPESKEIFYDDLICAMVFYGMPALIESNVNNLIEEMYRRGYRKFSLVRPDKTKDKLSDDEKKYGGIPSSSENVLQMMSSNLETYIEYNVGEQGNMLFNRTLQDWLVFDSKKRTKRDASISSSLALIAANSKQKRSLIPDQSDTGKELLLMTYDNTGTSTKIIQYDRL